MEANQKTKIATLTGEFVAALQHRAEEGQKASQEAGKAVDKLRTLAITVAAEGLDIGKVSEFVAASMKAAKMSDGTIRPYRQSFQGYAMAAREGVNLADYRKNANGKPMAMTAKEARDFLARATETPEQKAERERGEAFAKVRAEIRYRVNAIDDLKALEALRDSLPEVEEGEETPAAGSGETKAEREARQAAEAAKRLLDELDVAEESTDEAVNA